MSLRHRIARRLAPDLMDSTQVRDLVAEEVKRAIMAQPAVGSYDPDQYRRISGAADQRRDYDLVSQEAMFQLAYYMFDQSPIVRRLAKMDKSFLFHGEISVTVDDENAQEVWDKFWKANKLALNFPKYFMWLSLLGEQCWPVAVNPHNGAVTLQYIDPATIRDVLINPHNVIQVMRVDLNSSGGRPGKKYAVIREDRNPASKTYTRLVGDCFFLPINNPPNNPRGRSDYLPLFDWCDALERYGFNYLERSEHMLNFVWDVLLKGQDEKQIRKWLDDNPVPKPGSMRAHNENVEWKAVAPDIKAGDFRSGFDMAKGFVMGSAGRPESWFGGGGKSYQNEADLMGQVPIRDYDERQGEAGQQIEEMARFVLDQAVIHKRLTPAQADLDILVDLPEIDKRDLTKLANGVPQLATALAVAEQNRWLSRDTAARIFAAVVGQMGIAIDVEAELKAAKKRLKDGFEDYDD